MQSYLYNGGGKDGISVPTPDSAESVQLPVVITGRETYKRATLTVDAEAITVYIHESLTPAQALDLLVKHYKAWCVNRPSRRR